MATSTLNGVIIIDKPPDLTSHTVVGKVKKLLHVGKAGHTGTLDPFATGVLPVCLNEGTKLSPFLMEQDKEYEGVILLGVETDTQDSTGKIIRSQEPGDLDHNTILGVFKMFEGSICQLPPMFSAIKRNGVALYTLARQGLEVERNPRPVTVHSLDLLNITLPRIFFRVACSKGTYIRTLAGDIGTRLGCGGSLEALRRIRSGQFSIEHAVTLGSLMEMSPEEIVKKKMILPPALALASLPAIVVNNQVANKVQHGIAIGLEEGESEGHVFEEPGEKLRILTRQGQLLAVGETVLLEKLAELEHKKVPGLKLLRVFNVL